MKHKFNFTVISLKYSLATINSVVSIIVKGIAGNKLNNARATMEALKKLRVK